MGRGSSRRIARASENTLGGRPGRVDVARRPRSRPHLNINTMVMTPVGDETRARSYRRDGRPRDDSFLSSPLVEVHLRQTRHHAVTVRETHHAHAPHRRAVVRSSVRFALHLLFGCAFDVRHHVPRGMWGYPRHVRDEPRPVRRRSRPRSILRVSSRRSPRDVPPRRASPSRDASTAPPRGQRIDPRLRRCASSMTTATTSRTPSPFRATRR